MKITGRVIAKKNNYRSGKGFFYSSPAWKRFEEDALWQLKAYKERYTGPVGVEYTFLLKGKLDTDLSNMETAIDDILEKAGIIDNDKNIISRRSQKYLGYDDWLTLISVSPASAPPRE